MYMPLTYAHAKYVQGNHCDRTIMWLQLVVPLACTCVASCWSAVSGRVPILCLHRHGHGKVQHVLQAGCT